MTLLSAFGIAALALAAVGVYAAASIAVAQRTQEIGVRIALGAEPRAVVRLVLEGAFLGVAVGLASGVACALLLGRTLQAFLYDVGVSDPAAYIAAVTTLLAAASIAGYVPAKRASRIDPLAAMRE
jgi:putative ABC transport system permease protein